MANPDHVSKLREGVEAWNAWREENSDVVPDLQGTKLLSAKLQSVNLFKANLREANLQGANLWRAELFIANLQGANLQGANLFRANLQGANLREANLEDANLISTNLEDANLREANLEGANLFRANLKEANLFRASLQGTNLRESDLRITTLDAHDLIGAYVTDTTSLAPEIRDQLGFAEGEQGLVEDTLATDAPAWIYLSEEGEYLHRDRLLNAVGAFMEAMGLELKQDEEPIHGSWLKNLKFKFWESATSEDAKRAYQEGADAIRSRIEGSTAPEQSAKLASATADLVASVEAVPSVAIRLGNIVLIKQTIDGEVSLWVETVSPAIMRQLERQPLAMRHPESALRFIKEQRDAERQALEDSEEIEGELDEPRSPTRETGSAPGVET